MFILKFKNTKLFIVLFAFIITSCVVRAPRFTMVEKVFELKMGMTKEEVSQVLNVKPYNFKLLNDTVSVLLYKYRVTDRVILPFLLKENNGRSVRGKYVNLMITYNVSGKATRIESCNDCDPTTIDEKKFDVNKVVTFLTVTLPVVLVFLGIKFGASVSP
ncbi:MAG: hypothetical protein ABIP51_16455 [Bacteroidia bacterium]